LVWQDDVFVEKRRIEEALCKNCGG
jgi:hypothetical protein